MNALPYSLSIEGAKVAELVDAVDSKSTSREGVGVRVPSLVPPTS